MPRLKDRVGLRGDCTTGLNCICHSAGLGKPRSIVHWPDCAPCHSLPDGGGGNRPPSGQPNVPANSRQSGLRVPLAASSPRYLALTNIRRRSQSLPAATEDRHRPPLTPPYPKSCPGHRPPLPLSPVPLLHSHPFGGFGFRQVRHRTFGQRVAMETLPDYLRPSLGPVYRDLTSQGEPRGPSRLAGSRAIPVPNAPTIFGRLLWGTLLSSKPT